MQARGADPCGAPPLVAVILPPREGFGPGRTGALGMIAHRLRATPGFRTEVIGGPQAGPVFADAPFHAVRPAIWRPGNVNLRFAASVARLLRRMRPALIEVHNRPEIALALAARFPDTPVTVLLNNDPQAMRGARRPRERAALLRRLDRVLVASDWLRARLLDGIDAPLRPPSVLHNCIDLAALPPPAAREKAHPVRRPAGAPRRGRYVRRRLRRRPAALPGWRAEMIGADRFRADSPDTPSSAPCAGPRARREWRCSATAITRRCSPRWRGRPSWWCRAAGRSRSA